MSPLQILIARATRDPLARLRLALLIGFFLICIGIAGYMFIEHYTLLNALFMTVITLSTVGYEEVQTLHAAGKIFTIVLIVTGIGTATWVLTTFVDVFVSETALKRSERSRMDSDIAALKNHYIVCGYGRIGQQIIQGYKQNDVPYVVIEQDPGRVAQMSVDNVLCIEGDGADDDILISAGLHRARCMIAVTPSDAVNTFVVLSARGLRNDLFIVARCDSLANESKLLRAGANRVVSTHALGGRWMATLCVNPAVIDFVQAMVDAEHTGTQLREAVIPAGGEFDGVTFGAAAFRKRTGALIVAIRHADDRHSFEANPDDAYTLHAGDVLIAIGSLVQLRRLSVLVNPLHAGTIAAPSA